jgi:23S rRNA pseudouridine1911/1915/1917 synthase
MGRLREIYKERKGMVHRLDKDTSGVIVFAKNPGSLVNLLAQFRERKTNKRYLCMVHGCPRFDSFTINAPLGRARIDRKKFAVTVDGREAVTDYKVIKKIPFSKEFFEPFLGEKSSLSLEEKKLLRKNLNLYQAGFALVNCWPKTGRTHQIRVHMAHVQNPLVGDTVYAGRKRANIDPLWCPRQFLHAERLEVLHPRSGEGVGFEGELEGEMKLLV